MMKRNLLFAFLLLLSGIYGKITNLQKQFICGEFDLTELVKYPFDYKCLQVALDGNHQSPCISKLLQSRSVSLQIISLLSLKNRDIRSVTQSTCQTFLIFARNINVIKDIFDQDNKKQFFPFSKIYIYVTDSLKGKVVWITGASSGIGKNLGIVLARHGVKLCLSSRREEELEKVKSECLDGSLLQPSDIFVLKMDMLETDKHQEYFDQVIKYFGQVDVLVNNAGRSQRALWQDIDLKVDRELFDLDVFSVVNLSRIYIRHVEKNSLKGHIAVTSSSAGLLGVPNSCSYVGAKHALHGYFDSLKIEMPDFNITLFCPGPTTTSFLSTAFTNKPGENYGGAAQASTKRMSAERCAFLMATSIANKLHTSFVGPFPVPFLIYVSLYCPNVRLLLLKAIGKGGLQKIRDPEKRE